MKLPVTLTLAVTLISMAVPLGSRAQDMTDAELTAVFRNQIDDIRAAKEDSSLGASRGLVLVPVAPSGAESPSTSPPVTVESAAEPPGHWTLPKAEQVNFQVKFAFDSAVLSADQQPQLRRVCAAMNEAGVQLFRIVGHTDVSGSAEYNQKLSILRAEEVERFFVNDCGIAPDRLEAIGVGEQFPYDDQDPLAGVNRRVEFQALS